MLWTPAGYYMASPGAEELIGWQVNRGFDEAPEWYSAARFRDRFYRPEVIDHVLDTLDIDEAVRRAGPVREHGAPRTPLVEALPPVVSIVRVRRPLGSPENAVVSIRLEAPADAPAQRVSALVDGVQVRAAEIGPDVAAEPEHDLIVELKDRSSVLLVMAENAHGWSDAATHRFPRPTQPHTAHKPAGTLHLVAVGVNKYKHYDGLKLNHAAADARALVKLLETQKDRRYRHVKCRQLIDTDATKRQILRALADVERSMQPDDVVMLLFAGHGINDSRRGFYFCGHDVELGDDVDIRTSALGFHEIKPTLSACANKGPTLVFMDACRAGSVMPGQRAAPPDADRAIHELTAPEAGVSVLTACAAGQSAFERPEWGHGAFTLALLEAMEGKRYREGGFVRISHVANHVRERVAVLTDNKQTPPPLYVPGERFVDPRIIVL